MGARCWISERLMCGVRLGTVFSLWERRRSWGVGGCRLLFFIRGLLRRILQRRSDGEMKAMGKSIGFA